MTLAEKLNRWEITRVSIYKSYFKTSFFRKYIVVEGRAYAVWAGEDYEEPLVTKLDFSFTYKGLHNENPAFLTEHLQHLAQVNSDTLSYNLSPHRAPTLESYVRENYGKLDSTSEYDKQTIVPPGIAEHRTRTGR